jgi:hypothetical protein
MRSLLNTVLNGYWLPPIFAAVELNRDHAGKRPPESCKILYAVGWIFATGSTQNHKWRQRERAKGLPGFLHPLEDADSDISILKEAKKECAKLQ